MRLSKQLLLNILIKLGPSLFRSHMEDSSQPQLCICGFCNHCHFFVVIKYKLYENCCAYYLVLKSDMEIVADPRNQVPSRILAWQ